MEVRDPYRLIFERSPDAILIMEGDRFGQQQFRTLTAPDDIVGIRLIIDDAILRPTVVGIWIILERSHHRVGIPEIDHIDRVLGQLPHARSPILAVRVGSLR